MLLFTFLSGHCTRGGQLWYFAVVTTFPELWLRRSLTVLFFFVWTLLALTSCFAANLARTFSVQACGLYVPFYSFGVFATLSMLAVWTCGAVILWIDFCLFFLLGCSVFSGRSWILLLVCRFPQLGLVL